MEKNVNKYQNMSLRGFVDALAARTSIPGGGCVAALVASIGSSLGCMGGLLTYGNRKYEKFDAQIREILPSLYDGYQELLKLVDQDANAFNSYLVKLIFLSKKFYNVLSEFFNSKIKYF